MSLAIRGAHNRRFGRQAEFIVKSPGRVNLIGEHTDYNGGLVLPFCIEQSLYTSLSFNFDNVIRLYSDQLNDLIELDIESKEKTNSHFANCVIGALTTLGIVVLPNNGIDILISGDLPLGKGLSSSTALCTGLIVALSLAFGQSHSREEVAQLAFELEHDFIGIPCGRMDQNAICHGQQGMVMLIDCKNNAIEHISLPETENLYFSIVDSGIARQLHESQYRQRRKTCEQVLAKAKTEFAEVEVLSDLSLAQLDQLDLSNKELKRACFVLEENQRVRSFSVEKSPKALGELLNQGQNGLREKYEVSHEHIDQLVSILTKNSNVLGCRMVGGGFGGSVICISDAQLDLEDEMITYARKSGNTPGHFPVKISSGLEVVMTTDLGHKL